MINAALLLFCIKTSLEFFLVPILSRRRFHWSGFLPIKSQSEEWTEFFNTGTVIALHPRRKAKVNPRIAVLVGFMVTDLDDIVNKLKQQGVKFFKELKEEPFGKHTIIEDPDGHMISIAQIESKSAEGFDLLGFLIDMGVDIQE